MRIGFRVDCNSEIGTGHLIRCMRLAAANLDGVCIFYTCPSGVIASHSALYDKHNVRFVYDQLCHSDCGSEDANIQNFDRELIRNDAIDLLVIDSYKSSYVYEKGLSEVPILVIDDLAESKHYCDFLLDYSFGEYKEIYYKSKTPDHCKLLLGSQFALIDGLAYDNNPGGFSEPDTDLLLFMGGVDRDDNTDRILNALSQIKMREELLVTVVVGSGNPRINNYREKYGLEKNLAFISNPRDFYGLLAKTKYMISAGGTVSHEKILYKIPSLCFITSSNQEAQVRDIAKQGLHIDGGWIRDLSNDHLIGVIERFINEIPHYNVVQRLLNNKINPYGASNVLNYIGAYIR